MPIAIVDDDVAVRTAYADLFSSYDCATVLFATAEDFLAYLDSNNVECLILDQRLPGMTGLELQAALSELKSEIKTIFVTSQDDAATRSRAYSNGASKFFSKAGDVDEILRAVFYEIGYQSL